MAKRGPKEKPDKKVPFGTKIRPDQKEWLQDRENQAETVENALDMYRNVITNKMHGHLVKFCEKCICGSEKPYRDCCSRNIKK